MLDFCPPGIGSPAQLEQVSSPNATLLGRWEVERGKQYLGYDFAWHLGYDTAVTSEWGTPRMVESGVIPEELLAGKYGHSLHFFDLRKRRCVQTIVVGRTLLPSASSTFQDLHRLLSSQFRRAHRQVSMAEFQATEKLRVGRSHRSLSPPVRG
jgi:hypothetical protein